MAGSSSLDPVYSESTCQKKALKNLYLAWPLNETVPIDYSEFSSESLEHQTSFITALSHNPCADLVEILVFNSYLTEFRTNP
jgi:hypothetical protein